METVPAGGAQLPKERQYRTTINARSYKSTVSVQGDKATVLMYQAQSCSSRPVHSLSYLRTPYFHPYDRPSATRTDENAPVFSLFHESDMNFVARSPEPLLSEMELYHFDNATTSESPELPDTIDMNDALNAPFETNIDNIIVYEDNDDSERVTTKSLNGTHGSVTNNNISNILHYRNDSSEPPNSHMGGSNPSTMDVISDSTATLTSGNITEKRIKGLSLPKEVLIPEASTVAYQETGVELACSELPDQASAFHPYHHYPYHHHRRPQ